MVQMFSLINILNCLPPLIFVLKHICTRLTILTSSKNNHKIKVAETLQWPVGSQHTPFGLQVYYFIISENVDRVDYLYGGGGERERGTVVKDIYNNKNIYNLFRVIQMRLFMCMHAQEVFLQIRSIKKLVTVFKNGCNKIVFITKCNEKNCLKRITL